MQSAFKSLPSITDFKRGLMLVLRWEHPLYMRYSQLNCRRALLALKVKLAVRSLSIYPDAVNRDCIKE
jgi:hypothetical protein